jgi:N-acetylneuraminate synthase/N,N'-diacetyllegionaminate synthase
VSFVTSFPTEFRSIGRDTDIYVIAEAGVAHFGRVDLAEQLLTLAIEAGADAFKLQVFDVDQLIASGIPEWRDRLRSRNLPFEDVGRLRDRCRAAGLDFVLTAHDESRIEWLERLDVSAVKIGSGERNNPAFIARLAALNRPVILSTGMYREDDVHEALAACAGAGCERLALLHCVTAYPTPPAAANLKAMDRLRELFPGPVGYSDHTIDGLAVLAAAARGADIIEKHITILREVPNAQDWKVSSGPQDFPMLVADLRRVRTLLGSGRREPADVESEAERWALKSLVASRDLPAGHRLTTADLKAKRAGTGMSPAHLPQLLGRRLARTVPADTPVQPEDLEA